MLRHELDGTPYVKSDVNLALREGPLHGRTKASIEFRMQNISAALYDLRMPRIAGYLPANNVGNSVKQRIFAALNRIGIASFEPYISTENPQALAAKVALLRKMPLGSAPKGAMRPDPVISTVSTFVRDPQVKAWVLKASNGKCEGCGVTAPFLGMDGLPYLEVHHVVLLSAFGSDRISNACALCPNCHRRCHYSLDRDEFKLGLYERIERLVLEVPETDDDGTAAFI